MCAHKNIVSYRTDKFGIVIHVGWGREGGGVFLVVTHAQSQAIGCQCPPSFLNPVSTAKRYYTKVPNFA